MAHSRKPTLALIFSISPAVHPDVLHDLFAAARPDYEARDYGAVLGRSLCYICAYLDKRLVGFVNVAWDGGAHAFLLDTTVHPDVQRLGIGMRLVQTAIEAARERGIEWLYVLYEPRLDGFYRRCGFDRTGAGLLRLV